MADPTVKENDARLSLTLPSHLKETLKATGNANAYLRESAQRRIKRYRQSLERLYSWDENELRAVMDVLNGTMVGPHIDLGQQIAASMEDAERLNGTATAWGIGEDRWNELVGLVREREAIARAVRNVADEHWGEASAHVDL